MAQFWLQDEDSNILDLDDTVQQITLGSTKRNYKVINFAGANGGFIRGFGSVSPKKYMVSRIEKAENGDLSFFNSRRNDFLTFFNLPRWKDLYLYVRNGEDTKTVRTLVYTTSIGNEEFTYLRVTGKKKIELISPSGLLENIVASTGSQAISASVDTAVSITNSGTWEAPVELKYTPTTDATVIVFKIADEFGVRLERLNFTAGQEVIYNTSDNSLTIAGQTVQTSQFLTDGSVFNFPTGTFNLNVLSDAAGTFEYEYNERYI